MQHYSAWWCLLIGTFFDAEKGRLSANYLQRDGTVSLLVPEVLPLYYHLNFSKSSS